MRHETHDLVSLDLAEQIAAGLPQHSEWIELARSNLKLWMQLNADSPGLLRCYEEWLDLLTQPIEAICAALTAASDEGQRLRRNSPFAGVLSPQKSGKSSVAEAMKRPQLEHILRAGTAIVTARSVI